MNESIKTWNDPHTTNHNKPQQAWSIKQLSVASCGNVFFCLPVRKSWHTRTPESSCEFWRKLLRRRNAFRCSWPSRSQTLPGERAECVQCGCWRTHTHSVCLVQPTDGRSPEEAPGSGHSRPGRSCWVNNIFFFQIKSLPVVLKDCWSQSETETKIISRGSKRRSSVQTLKTV